MIIQELSDFIYSLPTANFHNPADVGLDPFSLVGKAILHKFFLSKSKEHTWLHGVVISYNPVRRTHEIAYDDEPEHQHYDLTEDILEGDIQIVDA